MSQAASDKLMPQDTRALSVVTPLGKDVLAVRQLSVSERLSQLFTIELELLSEDRNLDFDKLLGNPMDITLALPNDKSRYFHGHTTHFSQLEDVGRYACYRAVLRPWLWFLTQTSDCKIFQEKSVPEIIKSVLADHGYGGFVKDDLNASYAPRGYCVQYRETDFNFISRLMEEEGIYYYYRHEEGRLTLVLADDNNGNRTESGYATIPYHQLLPNQRLDVEGVYRWDHAGQVLPLGYAMNAFDFEAPRKNLASSGKVSRQHANADPKRYELYDYPGPSHYRELGHGNQYANIYAEAQQCEREQVWGESNALGLCAGALFTLDRHHRSDQNRQYLITATQLLVALQNYEGGGGAGGGGYSLNFTAIPKSVPFRPPIITPKPLIRGPQTAMVVGPKGEEIWTDQYGRIKCQFPWDRYGKADENSSCWVRVTQIWAGKKWGGIYIPRIGHEVIVEFLEGDPDFPIVTGCVYNGEAMPPYALPANATQSGVLSRSSKKGSAANANELRMEDKKGSEEFYMHAEKQFTLEVEEDEYHEVGRHRTRLVKGNEKVTIGEQAGGGNQEVTIQQNRTVDIKQGNDKLTIDMGNRTTKLKMGNDDLQLDMGNRTTKLKMGNDKLDLDFGNRTTTLKLGNDTTKLNVGKSTTQALQGIELKVGSNSIKIDMTGVTIKGMMVKVQGTAMLDVKAPMTNVKGDALLIVKGGIVMIN